MSAKIDLPQLEKYIESGFSIYPCTYKNKSPQPICSIFDEQHNPIIQNQIKTKERLQEFVNGNGFLQKKNGEVWQNKETIELFSLYPNQNNLFVIDIDGKTKTEENETETKHGVGTDGIQEFLEIIKKTDLTEQQKKMFLDFPKNFPFYVSTPNNGFHLYFKCFSLPEKWKLESNLIYEGKATNIECKYNKQITVAGSIKNGKQYKANGDITKIPLLPIHLLNAFSKPRLKIQNIQKTKKRYFFTEKITPEYCFEKGKEHCKTIGHNEMFFSVICNFHYWFEKTNDINLDSTSCKNYIMQTFEYLEWTDSDKENQIDSSIKQVYK